MTLSSHNQTPLQIGWKKLDGLSLVEFDRLCSDLGFVLSFSFRNIPQDELGVYFIPAAIEKFLCKEQLSGD